MIIKIVTPPGSVRLVKGVVDVMVVPGGVIWKLETGEEDRSTCQGTVYLLDEEGCTLDRIAIPGGDSDTCQD